MIQVEAEDLARYGDYLRGEERSRATVEKYLRDVGAFYRFLPQGKAVTKEAVALWKERLTEDYKTSSANSMLTAVNGFLRWAGVPECRVKLLRSQRRAFRDGERELTKGDYLSLVEAARKRRSPRLALILQTICGTGIRVSELRAITVESVGTGWAEIRSKGKTRRVTLPRKLRDQLAGYCRRRKMASGPVFVTRTGRPLDRSNLWSEMKGLCALAGVAPGKVFPHNLRHLFAVTFYRQEKDIVGLADLLGHSSVETTRIYTATSGLEWGRVLDRMGLVLRI